MRLAAIHLHPLKSGATLPLDAARIERLGLEHDRRWLVVDETGRFVTGRQEPRLVLVRATPFAGGVTLDAPGMERAARARARRQSRTPRASRSGTTRSTRRPAKPRPTRGFRHSSAAACGSPTWTPSPSRARRPRLRAARGPRRLRGRLPAAARDDRRDRRAQREARCSPLPVTRFRPNLVVRDRHAARRGRLAPHPHRRARVRAREAVHALRVHDGRSRDAATFDASGEPLATLKTYRRGPKGITFGQNADRAHVRRPRGRRSRRGDRAKALARGGLLRARYGTRS